MAVMKALAQPGHLGHLGHLGGLLDHPQVPTANFNELNSKINLLGCSVDGRISTMDSVHWTN
jgi:hypothetical protein